MPLLRSLFILRMAGFELFVGRAAVFSSLNLFLTERQCRPAKTVPNLPIKFHLSFSAFPLSSILPERRVCGCSLRLKNKSQRTT